MAGHLITVIQDVYKAAKEVRGFQTERDELVKCLNILESLYQKIQQLRQDKKNEDKKETDVTGQGSRGELETVVLPNVPDEDTPSTSQRTPSTSQRDGLKTQGDMNQQEGNYVLDI